MYKISFVRRKTIPPQKAINNFSTSLRANFFSPTVNKLVNGELNSMVVFVRSIVIYKYQLITNA